jgi:hypothetical protein
MAIAALDEPRRSQHLHNRPLVSSPGCSPTSEHTTLTCSADASIDACAPRVRPGLNMSRVSP